jgi:hypothetical protein
MKRMKTCKLLALTKCKPLAIARSAIHRCPIAFHPPVCNSRFHPAMSSQARPVPQIPINPPSNEIRYIHITFDIDSEPRFTGSQSHYGTHDTISTPSRRKTEHALPRHSMARTTPHPTTAQRNLFIPGTLPVPPPYPTHPKSNLLTM